MNIVMVGDRFMARLHRQYLGVRGTTDVLTFDLSVSRKAPIEGEIYICLDQARRQAKEYRVPFYLEMARLAVHGVLHLSGLKDSTPRQSELMRARENEILSAIAHSKRARRES